MTFLIKSIFKIQFLLIINTDTHKNIVEPSDVTSRVLGSAAPQAVARLTNQEGRGTLITDGFNTQFCEDEQDEKYLLVVHLDAVGQRRGGGGGGAECAP